jgi:glycosyltransferase involved in cell wall biosynthesis
LNFNDKKNLFTNVNNLEIVTHSKWLANLVNQSFLSEYKVNVSPSAINLDLFKPLVSDLKEKFDIKDKSVILGCASVWSTRKGLDDFLKLNKIIGKEYQIVLIGLNMKQIKLLPDTIIGINRTESIEELAKWYSLATVFVNPTTQDNFPTTNIEALACGTPIVTYNTGGSPEAIDKEIGEVVEKGDVHGLYDAIKHLASMNQKTLSDRCLKHAQNEFDKRIRYLDYLDIFKKSQ